MENQKTAAPVEIESLLAFIAKNESLPDDQFSDSIDLLQRYECWQPLFRLIRKKIENPNKREIGDYLRLAHIQGLYLDDWFAAAETSFRLVRDFNMSYGDFRKIALGDILTEEDYNAEATILQGIYNTLPADEDKVHCLERLCLIYEKKKFDEYLLNQSYGKLIELDPNNMKALKYFKVLYIQNYEWEEVVKVLQTMHVSSTHKNDKFRIAQELATVYLYQMNAPKEAIEVIETLCQESPLDTSTVHFEAYFRMLDWPGCLKVLRESLLKAESDKHRAIIYFKIGELEEKLGHFEKAEESLLKSAQLSTTIIEPVERLVMLSLENKEWQKTKEYLHLLESRVRDVDLKMRVVEAIDRIKLGIDSQASNPQVEPPGDTQVE